MTRVCKRRGKIEAWDPMISDVLMVKRVLEGESLRTLKNQTEKRYFECRSERLKREKEQVGCVKSLRYQINETQKRS